MIRSIDEPLEMNRLRVMPRGTVDQATYLKLTSKAPDNLIL
jgi:hypothetical protein